MLVRSIREDGFTQPVIVRRENRQIVDGEHRWRAGKALGMKEIPVVFVSISDEQAKIATLRHNRARGSEDINLTADIMRDLIRVGAGEWAKNSLMLTDTEINRLLTDVSAASALAGDAYSEAWAPAQGADGAQLAQNIADGREQEQHASAAAVQTNREREAAISQARNAEERAAIQRDMDVVRLAFVFVQDEARTVRSVLGTNPAARLVELCTAELNRQQQ